MPNPLDALKKAQTIQAAPQSDALDKGGWFDNAVEGLKGYIGLGDSVPSSEGWNANHIGQMLGAAVPLAGGNLGKVLEGLFAAKPEARGLYEAAMTAQAPEVMAAKQAANAEKYARNANVHDALLDLAVSDRPRLIPTETGVEIPIPKTVAPPVRPDTTYGSRPTVAKVPPGVKRDVPAEFESKISTLGLGIGRGNWQR